REMRAAFTICRRGTIDRHIMAERNHMRIRHKVRFLAFVLAFGLLSPLALAQSNRLQSSDLSRLRDVGQVALSPDGTRVVYSVSMNDKSGRPYSQLWVRALASEQSIRLGGAAETSSADAVWSPNGQWVAFHG